MVAMSARSRSPETVSAGIDSKSVRASSALSMGVFPFLELDLGPRTIEAGFPAISLPSTSQSNMDLMPARCCLTVWGEASLLVINSM